MIEDRDLVRASIATARDLIRSAERAIAQLEASILGNEAEPATDAWPPDPSTIDLNDGTWLTPKQAEGIVRKSPETILNRLRAGEPMGIKVGGRWWVRRDRLFR